MNKNPLSGKILPDYSIDQMLLEKGIKISRSLQLRYLSSILALSPSIPAGKLRHSETSVGFGALQGGQTPSAAGVKEECPRRSTRRTPVMLLPRSPNLCVTAKSPPVLIAPQGQTRRNSQFLQQTMAEPATACSSDFY